MRSERLSSSSRAAGPSSSRGWPSSPSPRSCSPSPARAASRPRAPRSACRARRARPLRGALRTPPGARPARDPPRCARADAARLRRRAPVLRRPPAGWRDRPPAAALRADRGLRSRARVASRACARARAGALPREISLPLGALASFAALSVLWSSADAPAQNLLQYFLLPFTLLVAVVARSPFPGLDAACSRHRRRRPRCGLRHRRPRRGGDGAAHLLHALGPDRERVLELLPHHLAVPRPEPVRAPPRARDRDRAHGRLVPEARDRARGDRHRLSVRRALLLLLAVEPRGALRRRRLHLGRRGRPRRPDRRSRDRRPRARGWRRFRRRQGRGRLDPEGDQRPLAPDRPDRQGGEASSPARRGSRLPAAGEPGGLEERRPAEPLRLAHDAAHGGCGARGDRPRPLRLAARGRREGAAARLQARSALRARSGRSLRRPLRPLALLQRLLRGSRHLARARRRLELPRCEAAARRRSRA